MYPAVTAAETTAARASQAATSPSQAIQACLGEDLGLAGREVLDDGGCRFRTIMSNRGSPTCGVVTREQ
jgi:hypothetical protein